MAADTQEEAPQVNPVTNAQNNNGAIEGSISSPVGPDDRDAEPMGPASDVAHVECRLDPVDDSWSRSLPSMSDPDVTYGYRRCDDGTDRLVAIEDGEAGEP
ncbi:hypothetical protein FTX61_20685, partial [Nitriliruptoraceae bacterium ZYF776]|nr:hypothetical protein [Profundirhabdus halotolerans]